MINIIAETAWHHEGDFEFMINLIDKLNQQEIDFIKVHVTLDLDEYMDNSHPAYETLKKWVFTENQWRKIIERIISGGKKPFILVNDKRAIALAGEYNPEIVEIHSVCLNDVHLLNEVKAQFSFSTKIVLGVGGSTLYEIENSMSVLNTNNIVLMHGFQNYPTKYEDINFNKILKLKQLYSQYEHGYADHCGWNEPNNILITTIGAALGMQYIEKHVTTNFGEERCDWNSAISFEMLAELVQKLKLVSRCNGNGNLSLNEGEKQYSQTGIMKKAPVFTNDLKKGSILKESDIVFRRIGFNTDVSQLEVIEKIGKKVNKDVEANGVIKANIFE